MSCSATKGLLEMAPHCLKNGATPNIWQSLMTSLAQIAFIGLAGVPALAPGDQPVRLARVRGIKTNWSDSGFIRDKPYRCRNTTQERPSLIEPSLVLCCGAQPDIRLPVLRPSFGNIFSMCCGRFFSSSQSSDGEVLIRLNRSARHRASTWLSNAWARDAQKTRCRRPWWAWNADAAVCHLVDARQ